MNTFYTYVGIIASLVAIIGGVVTILEKNKIIGKKMLFVILSVLGVVLISGVIISTLTTISNPPTNPMGNSPSSTVTPNSSPSPTQMIPSPTATSTPPPLLTTTPSPLGAVTLNENIRLSCDCSDPVVATITKIAVEPANNRMIWSLTLFNGSPNGTYARFHQFYLEKGDQVQYPTTGDQTTYDAMGGGVDTSVSLQAGETKQIFLTFSYVPYKDTPYTLESELVLAYFVADDSF